MVDGYPYESKLEANILGSLITNEGILVNNIRFLDEGCFYLDKHKKVFNVIKELFTENKQVDLISVTHQLKKNKSNVDDLFVSDLCSSSTSYNTQANCFILKEYQIRRILIKTSNDISKKSFDESVDVFDTLEEVTKKIDKVSMLLNINQFCTIEDVLNETIKEVEEASKKDGNIIGVTSGFTEVDRVTSGWSKSDLIIVAARPSMGKSSLARSFIMNACSRQNKNVVFFSLEESRAQIGKKLISSIADIPYEKIKLGKLNDTEWAKLHGAVGQLEKMNLTIDDTSGLSVFELKSKCRMLNHQKKLDMVVVDYLQLMRGEVKRNANREQEISYISRNLKGLAKELSIPVIALAQLSRAVETRSDKKPMLSDLRESGSLEQDADLVGFIYRPEYYGITEIGGLDVSGQAKFIIAKHRSGELGEPKLEFIADKAKFVEPSLF